MTVNELPLQINPDESRYAHTYKNKQAHTSPNTNSLPHNPSPSDYVRAMHISPSEDRLNDPKLPGSRALYSSMLVNNGSLKVHSENRNGKVREACEKCGGSGPVSPPPWSMESAGMAMDRAVEGLQGATRSSAPETLISNGPRG